MKSFRRHCESGDALAEVGIADQTGGRETSGSETVRNTRPVILSFFSSSPVSRVRLSVKVSAM